MKSNVYKWKIYYPWKTFTEFEIVKEWKDVFRVYVELEEKWKKVKASIFSWKKKQIDRMFEKWCFEGFKKNSLFD